jgi:hypothetical protein
MPENSDRYYKVGAIETMPPTQASNRFLERAYRVVRFAGNACGAAAGVSLAAGHTEEALFFGAAGAISLPLRAVLAVAADLD